MRFISFLSGSTAQGGPWSSQEAFTRWRPHLSTPPQFRHGTGGEENILQPPAPVVSAATSHKTFGPNDLTSMYSVCTRKVFGGIETRPSSLESDGLNTRLPTSKTSTFTCTSTFTSLYF
ncbi:uncharacterized protein TNCV_4077721 [Trichonephila clavipes]|nr:uncharacterized protein TNCV_4077721 [Trichonephila clavipes]